jgi:hypothetical protein
MGRSSHLGSQYHLAEQLRIHQPPKGDQETIVTFGCQWGTGERLH